MDPITAAIMLAVTAGVDIYAAYGKNTQAQHQADIEQEQVAAAARQEKIQRTEALNKSLGTEIERAGASGGLEGSKATIASNDVTRYNYDIDQIKGQEASRNRSIAYQRKASRFNSKLGAVTGIVSGGLSLAPFL